MKNETKDVEAIVDPPHRISVAQNSVDAERAQSSYRDARLLCRVASTPTQNQGQAPPLYAASVPPLHRSLRAWSKSTKTHPTDQNLLCEHRMSRLQTNRVIPPASQTAAVWHMLLPPRITSRQELSLGSIREDVHYFTEWTRKYIEQLRLKNERTGFEPEGTAELQRDWDKWLQSDLKKPAEVVHVKVDRTKITTGKLSRAERLQLRWNYKSDLLQGAFTDDEQGAGFDRQSDHIADYGGTEVTQHTNLDELRRWWVLKYNPEKKKWTAELKAEARKHPDFLADAARFLTEFGGRTIQEVIDEMRLDAKPNTVSQRIRRTKTIRNPYNNFRTNKYRSFSGSMVCVFILNDRVQVRKLVDCAELPVPPELIASALETQRKQSERVAVKNASRLTYTESETTDAIERVNKAYRDAYVMYWLGESDPEDTDVMDFPMYEEANDEQPQD
jgi:hypothetical protein